MTIIIRALICIGYSLILFYSQISIAIDLKNRADTEEVILKPQMLKEAPGKPIYRFNTTELMPYLDNIVILSDEDEFSSLPYLSAFATGTHSGATGDKFYAKGLGLEDTQTFYTLLSAGDMLIDPDTEEKLGLQTYAIGEAELKLHDGKTHTLMITKSTEAVDVGARLLSRFNLNLPAVLEAKIPAKNMLGYVVFTKYQNTGVGKFSSVILNLGARDGVEQGDLLYLVEHDNDELITKHFGEIVIYKVMDKISLGFILNTSRAVLMNDKVAAVGYGG